MEYSEIKELIEIFEKTDLNDMEVMLGNDRLRLNRSPVPPFPMVPSQSVPQVSAEPFSERPAAAQPVEQNDGTVAEETAGEKKAEGKTGKIIKAPIVGTFYRSSAPNADPFVKEGDAVEKGDVVCIIEAMKYMNEVNSEFSGKILEIFVEDGTFVEYGQELFRLG